MRVFVLPAHRRYNFHRKSRMQNIHDGADMKFIDLFCGIGGLSYGLKKAGLIPLAGLDIEEHACRIYNDFVKPIYGVLKRDVFKLNPDELPDPDIIVGCPPCQGFSAVNGAGRESKKYDRRNDLVRFFSEIVYVKKPQMFFFENVPPLINSQKFDNMVGKLREIYDIAYKIVDLGKLGGGPWEPVRPLTHRRRLVCIGVRKDLNRRADDLFPEEGSDPLPLNNLIEERPEGDNRKRRLSEKLRNLAEHIRPGMKRENVPEDIKEKYFYKCWLRTDGFRDVFSRVKTKEALPYVTGGILTPDKGPFLHPVENRGFTVEEAKYIMSFPRELDLSAVSITKAESFIGNAFPPQSAYAFGLKIKELMDEVFARESKDFRERNIELSYKCGSSVA